MSLRQSLSIANTRFGACSMLGKRLLHHACRVESLRYYCIEVPRFISLFQFMAPRMRKPMLT